MRDRKATNKSMTWQEMSAYNVKVERARLKNIYIEAARIPNAIEKVRDLKYNSTSPHSSTSFFFPLFSFHPYPFSPTRRLSFGDDAMLGGITIGQKMKSGLYEAVGMFAASAPNVDIVCFFSSPFLV